MVELWNRKCPSLSDFIVRKIELPKEITAIKRESCGELPGEGVLYLEFKETKKSFWDFYIYKKTLALIEPESVSHQTIITVYDIKYLPLFKEICGRYEKEYDEEIKLQYME